jgi:hypothetical protein
MVGGSAATATPGRTNEGGGLPGSGLGRGRIRDEVGSWGVTYPTDPMGRGCLFWLLVSVVLSVTLTVVVNLLLFALSG